MRIVWCARHPLSLTPVCFPFSSFESVLCSSTIPLMPHNRGGAKKFLSDPIFGGRDYRGRSFLWHTKIVSAVQCLTSGSVPVSLASPLAVFEIRGNKFGRDGVFSECFRRRHNMEPTTPANQHHHWNASSPPPLLGLLVPTQRLLLVPLYNTIHYTATASHRQSRIIHTALDRVLRPARRMDPHTTAPPLVTCCGTGLDWIVCTIHTVQTDTLFFVQPIFAKTADFGPGGKTREREREGNA